MVQAPQRVHAARPELLNLEATILCQSSIHQPPRPVPHRLSHSLNPGFDYRSKKIHVSKRPAQPLVLAIHDAASSEDAAHRPKHAAHVRASPFSSSPSFSPFISPSRATTRLTQLASPDTPLITESTMSRHTLSSLPRAPRSSSMATKMASRWSGAAERDSRPPSQRRPRSRMAQNPTMPS